MVQHRGRAYDCWYSSPFFIQSPSILRWDAECLTWEGPTLNRPLWPIALTVFIEYEKITQHYDGQLRPSVKHSSVPTTL